MIIIPIPITNKASKNRIKIDVLKNVGEFKDKDIIGYIEKIEHLEDTILRLEALIPDKKRKDSKKKGKIVADSKLAIKLDELEKEVRELKNSKGFLRKEKIQLQHELEKYTKKKGKSTVIRIVEKKKPLEALVTELTLRINKQQQLIKKLKADVKKEEIDALKSKIAKLNKELEHANSIARIKTEGSSSEIRKKIQDQLHSATSERKTKHLKKKLDKYEKPSKQGKRREEFGPAYLQKKIEDLRVELNKKNLKIKDLKKSISTLKATQKQGGPNLEVKSSEETFKALLEELQRKLNTARKQNKILQEKLKEYKIMKAPVEKESEQEIIDELRSKIEKLTSQEQVEGKIESPIAQVIIQDELNLALRVRELKNFVEDLQKQNDQQRLEISTLRKKMA